MRNGIILHTLVRTLMTTYQFLQFSLDIRIN